MAEPSDGGERDPNRPASSGDIIGLYQKYLGRLPENDGAIQGRLGRSLSDVEAEISGSLEAQMHKILGPVGPVGPPPTTKPKDNNKPTSNFVSNIPGLSDALNWIQTQLGAKIADAQAAVDAAKAAIQDQLDTVVSKTLPALGKAITSVQTSLTQQVTSLIPNTLNLLGAGLGGVANLIGTFLSNSADIGDIADVFVQTAKDHEEGMSDFLHNTLGGAFAFGLNAALLALVPSEDKEHPVRSGIDRVIRDYVAFLDGVTRNA